MDFAIGLGLQTTHPHRGDNVTAAATNSAPALTFGCASCIESGHVTPIPAVRRKWYWCVVPERGGGHAAGDRPLACRFGIWPLALGSLLCTHFGGLLSVCSKSYKTFVLTLSTSGLAQASGNLLPPPNSVGTTSGDTHVGAEILAAHPKILVTCSGAV
jgi:hypothetical protein